MYHCGPIQWCHFQANLIWPDGIFKKIQFFLKCTIILNAAIKIQYPYLFNTPDTRPLSIIALRTTLTHRWRFLRPGPEWTLVKSPPLGHRHGEINRG